MPCDLGYKSFTTVTIPVPKPLAFRKRVQAPKVDAELLALIGQQDPVFIEWMQSLDIEPLLQQALEAAGAGSTGGLRFSIKDGALAAEGSYTGASAKKKLDAEADRVGRRWQMEVLAIVARLLDFEATVVDNGGTLMLEGEKHGHGQVHEYLRVTLDPARGSSMLFEHFATKEERDLVRAKFVALAQKLGVRIDLGTTRESGSPIPAGAVHKHFIKGGKR